ncbi:MAG TPA: hypothetical protein VGX78_19080 [Pirellulales bacterium]|nr:hypothetical protein [Pirellulales bacterium]
MSIRCCAARVLSLVWLAPLLLIVTSAPLAAQESEPKLGEKEAAIEAALAQPASWDFRDQPLSDVVDFLNRKHEIQAQLDNKALADAGIGSETKLTRHVHELTLSSALDLLLAELRLTYVVKDEVLLITTKTEAESLLSTRVYPVADLVLPREDDLVVSSNAEFGSLIEMITSTAHPDSWDDTGGPGTIRQHNQSLTLVISQSYQVHREISTLFESLRAVDRRQAVERHAAEAPVAQGGNGLQLKVYKLPMKWQQQYALAAWQQQLAVAAWQQQQWKEGFAAGFRANSMPPAGAEPASVPVTAPAQAAKADEAKPGAAVPPAPAPQPMPTVAKIPGNEELVKAIPALIEPASWDVVGGAGTIRELNGALVVRQSAEVQYQIRQLLEALSQGNWQTPGMGGMGGGF